METEKEKRQLDMLHGSIWNKLPLFALPVAATAILEQLFNASDIAVVGNFTGAGKTVAVAAVGANSSIIALIVNLFVGIALGANVVIANAIGRDDWAAVKKAVHTSIVVAFLGGIFVAVIGELAAAPLLCSLHVPDDVFDSALLYLRIYLLGMPVILLYNFEAAIFRSVGETKIPLIALFVSGILNVALNLFFVAVLRMTVNGVAIATVISNAVSSVLLLRRLRVSKQYIHVEWQSLRIDWTAFGQIMKIGLPAGMQSVIFNISNVLIQSSINSFGAVAVAGNTAAANVEGFVYISMNSLYQTTLSFTSQNLGAKQYRRVDGILVRCMILVILIGVVLGQGAYRLGDPLLHIYSQDPEVIAFGIQRFSVVSVTYFLCGMMDVGSGVVRGLGYSIMPMLVSMVGACVFRVIWIFTVFRMYHTLFTLYVSYPISWVLTVIAHMICYLIVRRRMFPEKAA